MTVKPLPILQIINLVFGIMGLLFEWPASFLAGSSVHRSIALRLFALPLFALAAAMIYQATNPAIYYTIATVVYFWAYSEGEVSPWFSLSLALRTPTRNLITLIPRECEPSHPLPSRTELFGHLLSKD